MDPAVLANRDGTTGPQGSGVAAARRGARTDGASTPQQSVYFFGNGKADGTREMKRVLGGKGANLAEMTNLGIPVPPGFTIACQACVDFLGTGAYAPSLVDEVSVALKQLEEATGRRF